MAKLTVTRVSDSLGVLARHRIVVDGEPVEKLSNGQTVQVDIRPGCHEVIVEMNGCKSNPILLEVEPEGVYHLEVGPRLRHRSELFSILWVTAWMGLILFWQSPIPYQLTLYGAPLVFLLAFQARPGVRPFDLRSIPDASSAHGTPARLPQFPVHDSDTRISIRWLMIVIALLAVLLGVDVLLSR